MTQCGNVDVPTGSSQVLKYSEEIEFRSSFFCAKQLWHALAEGILWMFGGVCMTSWWLAGGDLKLDQAATSFHTWPISSTYGVYLPIRYIWLIFMVNVGKYTIHGWYAWYIHDVRSMAFLTIWKHHEARYASVWDCTHVFVSVKSENCGYTLPQLQSMIWINWFDMSVNR